MLDTRSRNELRTARFDAPSGKILLSGIDALVRIGLERKRIDLSNGWNTAGFISGYRGSPLGGFDIRLQSEQKRLDAHSVIFQPGINEDLAVTAVWGTQQVGLYAGAKYDGVFGIWYGKTPGVDRSGDALKHANAAGTSPRGGVLAIAGDDHGCKSSSIPGQSEYNFVDAEIPVLAPSTIEEVLYFGVKALDMSRYSGLWSAMTVVAELMDSTVNMTIDPLRFKSVIPENTYDDVHIRLDDTPIDQEARLRQKRRPAAEDFAYHNDFDKFVFDTKKASLCIVTQGKAYRDVMQAFQNLGIDAREAKELGIRFYKPGMVWPLEKRRASKAIQDVSEVLVIEERRSLVETQLREYVCDLKGDKRPRIYGKNDRDGHSLVPDFGELNSDLVTKIIYGFLQKKQQSPEMADIIEHIFAQDKPTGERHKRVPYFCPGCPHNSSTNIPDGSRATAGIGCHYLVQNMPRNTSTFTQMGGEGVSWIGQAPFTNESHIFVNLGDGTYHHSGLLAIRQAVAAKVNVTYKILFNDAVAMTGGQVVDGPLTPVMIAHQLKAEGVGRTVMVGDNVSEMKGLGSYPLGVEFYDRSGLDRVQKDLRKAQGVTAIIYVQTCATELRRKRKRGLVPDPQERIFINERVCEGCADCSVKSNCIAVETIETEYGQKRRIDQLACNKDRSCVDGSCPSFVTLEGAKLKSPKAPVLSIDIPLPSFQSLRDKEVFELVLVGVGGQGITSLSAMLTTAAHLDGIFVNAVDALGMAQKGGAVYTHFKMSTTPTMITNARVGKGSANLILVNDMVVAHGPIIRPHASSDKTAIIANSKISASAEVVGIQDFTYDAHGMSQDLRGSSKHYFETDTTKSVLTELGDTVYNNLTILGIAWQLGHLPLSRSAIFSSIDSIGTKTAENKAAFELGRRLALDKNSEDTQPIDKPVSVTKFIDQRMQDLTAYQNKAYAERFRACLIPIMDAEQNVSNVVEDLTFVAARSLYKLMAYKDEYEVARLYSDPNFLTEIHKQFEGKMKIRLHLAPPIFGRKNTNGEPVKTKFPAWFIKMFGPLAKLKFLRGTPFDIFGKTEERKMERRLRDEFEALILWGIKNLTPENGQLIAELFDTPKMVKGYGHIKLQSVKGYQRKITRLKRQITSPSQKAPLLEAAE